MKNKLSVVLAVRNEEENIGRCLKAVQSIADEIIIFDEFSEDNTRKIARKFGAKVHKVKHEDNFHITKQKAINKASGDWILQLDADEVVTPELAKEIVSVLENRHIEFLNHQLSVINRRKENLFVRHQKLIEEREGISSTTYHPQSTIHDPVAFYIPRLNMFLGRPLKHAGVYPDGAIRLFKKGKAHLPCKSVHEVMEVDGQVGWLFNDLKHYDSPTLKRYLERANRYTDLTAKEFKEKKVGTTPFHLFYYAFPKPFFTFLKFYIRHKGFLDGVPGFVWSVFSALHFSIAYFKYWQTKKD
jgi:glycosyltransferase involved in cell wall biosynthesis